MSDENNKNSFMQNYLDAGIAMNKAIDEKNELLKKIEALEKEHIDTIEEMGKAQQEVIRLMGQVEPLFNENKNLIAALKKCLKSVFDHDLEAYLYSPEYQAIKHLLED